VRVLHKNPGVTAVALLTLALGIGANTAIFSLVYAALLQPLPYPHADRIVGIWEQRPTGERNAITTLNYLDYANQSTVFERVAATTGCCAAVTLNGGAQPIELFALRVSAPYFDILGVKAALGRTFVSGDDQPGRDHVVILSHALWTSQFGADETLIGRAIRLDGDSYTVVGVMPADSPFGRSWTQIWLPLSFPPERMIRHNHWLLTSTGGALGLLKPGVTLERARTELQAISARLATDYPDTNKGWGVVVEPYAAIIVGKTVRQSLYLLLAAVGMVLLIGCVNLANVMVARGLARGREVAIRAALGAGRGRLIQQFLTESVLLSLSGGLLGVAVGFAATAVLRAAFAVQPLNPSMPPLVIPAEARIGIDVHGLLFTFALSILCALVFGLAPALASTHTMARTSVGLQRRTSVHGWHRGLRNGLIVTEVALAFVLLTGAGLLIRSFVKMAQADTGFTATNVLTAELPIWDHRFAAPEQLRAYLGQIVTAIKALPGVQEVALTDGLPWHGVPSGMFFQIVGHPSVDFARRPVCDFKVVSPSYFRLLGLRIRAGRSLTENDRSGAPYVTVINETMARSYFPHEDPVGRHILMQETFPGTTREIPWEIVGVIADERLTPFDDTREHSAVYVAAEQTPTVSADLVVRSAIDPSRIQESVRAAVAAIDKDQAVTRMKTVDQLRWESMASDRLRSSLLAAFAGTALLLAAIGIYGVVSYSVVQRTREIGIRAALGASAGSLVRLVLGRGMALTALGLALGWMATLGVARLLAAFLFGVQPSDPVTLMAAVGVLGFVAAIACYIPARHTTRIDPLAALRAE